MSCRKRQPELDLVQAVPSVGRRGELRDVASLE
jgi:hypothetical protein